MAGKSSNKNLRTASKAKKDDFYTQLSDIEEELWHYKEHFRGKTVFCNCDDPHISKFFHYFSYNFENLGLKRLITTCYKNENVDFFSDNKSERAICLEYTGKKNGERVPTPEEIGIQRLKGNGDFRSKECIELLKQADIVVTNPPFSLFRPYIAQLMEYKKKFLILGSMNAITYKECFKLIQDNKMWLGVSLRGKGIEFQVPKDHPIKKNSSRVDENGNKFVKMGNVRWFTNLDYKQRYVNLELDESYYGHENTYPKYDNYDAINVDRIQDIPRDYANAMGVPITFVEKCNPNQFELLGIMNTGEKNEGIRYEGTPHGRPIVNGIEKYLRILIKNRMV
jgi:hypothetical protein